MMRLFFAILTATILLNAAGLNLGNLEKVELKGFQTNGVTALSQNGVQDELSWTIRGENALIQKPNYDLTGFQMTILDEDVQNQQKGTYHLQSPRCLYNQDTHLVRSESAIQLDGPDGLAISGIGYDIYLADAQNGLRLVIRDAVRLEFQLESLNRRHTHTQ